MMGSLFLRSLTFLVLCHVLTANDASVGTTTTLRKQQEVETSTSSTSSLNSDNNNNIVQASQENDPEARSLQGALPTLTLGQPVTSSLSANTMKIYTVQVPLPFNALRIIVSSPYGDSNVYASVGTVPSLSPATAQYSSVVPIGVDSIDITSTDKAVIQACIRTTIIGSTCTVTIGVQSTKAASFVITVSLDGRAKTLTNGVTVQDIAPAGVYPFHSYTPSSSTSNVTFMLTTYAGVANLYIGCSTLGQTRPRGDVTNSYCKTDTGYTASSKSLVNGGTLSVTPADGSCYCGTGTYFIAVGAPDVTAAFGLAVVDSSANVAALHDGIPLRVGTSSLPPVPMGVGNSIVSPPSVTSYFDFTFVPSSVNNVFSNMAVFTLSQYSAGSSSYLNGATLYARFHVDGDSSMVPSAATAQLSATVVAGSATLFIPKNDPSFIAACGGATIPLPCRVHLAVVSDVGSSFTLIGRTDTGIQLIDGAAVKAESPPGFGSSFRYFHTQPQSPVVITITPANGPVDIYVSNSAQPSKIVPTATSYTRMVRATSADVQSSVATLVFNPTDADSCTAPCSYYITVVPSVSYTDGTAVSFSVLARTRDATVVALLDGQPTTDVISSNEYNYYSVTFPPLVTTLTLSLLSLQGRAQMFIAVNGTMPGDGTTGSTIGQQIQSDTTRAIKLETSLVLTRTDPNFAIACTVPTVLPILPIFGGSGTGNVTVPLPTSCVVNIGVFSDVGGAYTVTAATGPRLLLDGVATQVSIPQNGITYVILEAPTGASHVTVSLSKLFGVPIAYVSSTERLPSPATSFTYTFGGTGSYTLTLDGANAVCTSKATSPRCVYYIGISTVGTSRAVVRVQATSIKVIPVTLTQPVAGRVGPSVFDPAFFAFTLPPTATTGVIISFERTTGGWINTATGTDIDPATGVVIPPIITCTAPGVGVPNCPAASTTYARTQWVVPGFSSRTRIVISPNDPNYKPGATYVVAAFSKYESDFVVSVTPIGDASSLLNGILMHDTFSNPTGIFSYKIAVSSVPTDLATTTVNIQGLPREGDILIYIGVNKPSPSATVNQGYASFAENYRIMLSPNFLVSRCAATPTPSPNPNECIIFITVVPAPRASYPVLFSIVASMGSDTSSPQLLLPGVTQLGAVARGGYAYYYTPISVPYGQSYYVNLVEAGDGEATVYVNTVGDKWPSNTSYMLASAGFISPEIVLVNQNLGPTVYLNETTLLISIYGVLDFNEFFVTVGTSAIVVELPDGVALEGSTEPGTYAYYSFTSGDIPGDINVAVTPLSGSASVYASVWYTVDSAAANMAFRPSRSAGGFGWRSNFEGALFIPSTDANACKGACTYIFAVYCDAKIICQFELSATSRDGILTRLSESVPAGGIIAEGTYRYYVYDAGDGNKNLTFSAQETTGMVQLFVSTTYSPSTSSMDALPRKNNPSSFAYSTEMGLPSLSISQVDIDEYVQGRTGEIVARSDHLYVIGVYALVGPATFSLVGRPIEAPQVLIPGMPSAGHLGSFAQVDFYSYDQLDMVNDLLITASLLFGDVTIAVATRGVVPVCTVVGTSGAATVTCAGAIWQVSSSNGRSAQVRVDWRNPCTGTNVVGVCDIVNDWAPGPVSIMVITTQQSNYAITADTAASPIRLLDGQPQQVTQNADRNIQYILFQVVPDSGKSDVRLLLSIPLRSASFNYYLSSCIDDNCFNNEFAPDATNNKLNGTAGPGKRVDIVITKQDLAFCTGIAVNGDICNYYLGLVPDTSICSGMGVAAPSCVAIVDITAISVASPAPILVPFQMLNDRMTVFSGLVRADRPKTYVTYINEPFSPDEETQDVVVRLDACDALRGHPTAYICVSAPGALGLNRPPCQNIRFPSKDDNNYQLSTSATGWERSILLSEPSNILYISTGVRVPNNTATEASVTKYGPPMYDLSLFVGSAVRLRIPWPEAPVAKMNRTSATSAIFTWPKPVVTQFNAAGAPNVTAVSVRYVVYVTPDTYTSYAQAITGLNTTELGIVPSTPCGLERWARIVASNYTPSYTLPDVTSISLVNLTTSKRYKINVVAICDANCIADNFVALGLPRPLDSALSTQRLSYSSTYFMVWPDPTPDHGDTGPVSTSFYAFGLIGLAVVGCAALFLAFRRKRANITARYGNLDGTTKAKTPDGRSVLVKSDSHFFSSRKLRTSNSQRTLAGTGGLSGELEELARVTKTVVNSPTPTARTVPVTPAPAPVPVVVAATPVPAPAPVPVVVATPAPVVPTTPAPVVVATPHTVPSTPVVATPNVPKTPVVFTPTPVPVVPTVPVTPVVIASPPIAVPAITATTVVPTVVPSVSSLPSTSTASTTTASVNSIDPFEIDPFAPDPATADPFGFAAAVTGGATTSNTTTNNTTGSTTNSSTTVNNNDDPFGLM